jgi:hypothetical protein
VDTENPIRIESAGFRSVREIIIVSTMSPFSSLFWLWSPPRFGPVPPSRLRSLLSDIRSLYFNRARHVVYTFDNPTDFSGFCCLVSGLVGGIGCTSSSRTPSSAGIGGRLRTIGPGNRAAVLEDQVSLRGFAS